MFKSSDFTARLLSALFLIFIFFTFGLFAPEIILTRYAVFVYVVIISFSIIYFGLKFRSIFAFILSLLIFVFFDYANSIKILAAGMPITPIYLTSTFKYPLGLLKSIGFNGSNLIDASLKSLFVLTFIFLVIHFFRSWRFLLLIMVSSFSALVYIGVTYYQYRSEVVPALYKIISEDDADRYPMWSPVGHANLSIDAGLPAYFLYFNHAIEASEPIIFSELVNRANPIDRDIVSQAVRQIAPPYESELSRPDIFIIHLESTFDPYAAFYLDSVTTSPLFPSSGSNFSEIHYEWSSGAIVNTVGGNSWISEFEVVTGIDSRAFGILGRYTHATLPGLIRKTFVTHLKNMGYEASLFTETSRNFFNYGNAYTSYGIDNIYDSDIMKTGGDDIATINSVIDLLDAANGDQPQFGMILLSENHSPHPCRDDVHVESGFVKNLNLGVSADCVLNVFLERAKHTETAVEILFNYLEKRRLNEGRDFILAMYGDHQPFSFTGGGGLHYDSDIDFSLARRTEYSRSVRETFVKIVSSLPTQINCCGKEYMPLTLLPTLISVIMDPSNVYMDVNLFQQLECGDDAFGYMMVENNFYKDDSSTKPRSFSCNSLPSILAFQQHFAL